jgi:hypothetical protein
MLTITRTLSKRSNDPWITTSNTSIFTQQEMDSVITPYLNFLNSLPGFQANNYTETFLNDTYTTIMCFDADENGLDVVNLLFGNSSNPQVVNKNNLINQKMKTSGVVYQRTLSVY